MELRWSGAEPAYSLSRPPRRELQVRECAVVCAYGVSYANDSARQHDCDMEPSGCATS